MKSKAYWVVVSFLALFCFAQRASAGDSGAGYPPPPTPFSAPIEVSPNMLLQSCLSNVALFMNACYSRPLMTPAQNSQCYWAVLQKSMKCANDFGVKPAEIEN